MGRLITVSNRLPVKVNADGSISRTTGGLTSALEGANLDIEQIWIGWPGSVDENNQDVDGVRQSLQKSGFHPVFLSSEEVDGYYEGYSNATLWPVLHYMVDRARFSNEWWEIYKAVNQKFAAAIVEVAQPDDVLWIHDYHLLLVPSMIRSMTKQKVRIGFFLHIPFCSSDVFRCLPHREEILRGLLGADLIGFQTFGYLRHFRSSLLRILGKETELFSLRQDGRIVKMDAYPIGHNNTGFQKVVKDESFGTTLQKQREALAGKRLILNVERLDYTKGVVEKLAAIRRFFEMYPDKIDDVVFILIAVPSRQGVKEYDDLTENVQREVGAINGKFGQVGHSPLQFFHRGFPVEELAAFYATAEVCMVTPLRDGMNLVAKEFVSCALASPMDRPGVLILSEFAGAVNELSDAIHVNPYDVDQVATAVASALDMPDPERRKRIERMQHRIHDHDSAAWARNFFDELGKMGVLEEPLVLQDLGIVADTVVQKVKGGQKIGIFLDYDGTLRDFVDVPENATPDSGLVSLLRDLAKHESIYLAVVSGRPASFLEKHLGNLGITLVAEHGFRWLDGGQGEWKLLNANVNTEWKDMIREHLLRTAFMTPGTHVEDKKTSIVWHYRKADPEFGHLRATDLLEGLTTMAANLPVVVHHGKKIVEVSSIQVNKGEAVRHLLNHTGCGAALVAGDDQTDESMISLQPADVDFYSIKIGPGDSRAMYRSNIAGLRQFLENVSELLHRN